ncbi:hypothetical protein L208DRAFT_1290049, partial [Tricholoma matsutake]
ILDHLETSIMDGTPLEGLSVLCHGREWTGVGRDVREEVGQVLHQAQKALDPVIVMGCFPLPYSGHLVAIHVETQVINHICRVVDPFYKVMMMSHPSSSMSRKRSFIMAWNVAGELHSPKNITIGSNSPRLVLNAAFHSSPFFICTLWYPHRMSSFMKNLAPFSLSKRSPISGRG